MDPIFRKYSIPFHGYADDIQIHFCLELDASLPLQPLFNCLQSLKYA